MKTALEGVVVLDLSRALAGPYCTLMLGDMGADIIKIEMPKGGDEARSWGPPFVEGESAYFLSVNRNKKSITLNLKHDRAKAIFKEMAAKADVVVENFRPGTMDKLGLGYDVLSQINPKIVYCAISGFGPDGPEADRPGYDLIAQGMGGIMSFTGEPGGAPLKVGVSLGDITAGMFAAYGVMTALFYRERTGQGQLLDTSLFESQIAQLTFQAGRYFTTGRSPEPMGNQHPLIAPYESFAAKDGFINIAVGNNNLWAAFCRVLGLEDYQNDPRFVDNPSRVQNRPELIKVIEEKTRSYTVSELRAMMDQAGIPNGPVWKVGEVLTSAQALARDMVVDLDHPKAGRIKVIGLPVKMHKSPGRITLPPPLLGEHTEEILTSWLNISPEEFKELKTQGVV